MPTAAAACTPRRDIDLPPTDRCPAVLGRVALWGRVIEHEHGYRARFAYPQRLRLICQFCFWQEPGGVHARRRLLVQGRPARPDVRPPPRGRRGERDRPRRILPAGLVDLRLRETYAVDTLVV